MSGANDISDLPQVESGSLAPSTRACMLFPSKSFCPIGLLVGVLCIQHRSLTHWRQLLQDWDNLRNECAEQLRQPLCLALLRNCTSPYDDAYALATRLFSALLLRQRLREGLKAELGAFYPLLLLRPMESDKCAAAIRSVTVMNEGLSV